MRNVVVNVDSLRRMVLTPEGGLQLEAYVEGFGWVLDNDADVSDAVLGAHLGDALAVVRNAAEHFGAAV